MSSDNPRITRRGAVQLLATTGIGAVLAETGTAGPAAADGSARGLMSLGTPMRFASAGGGGAVGADANGAPELYTVSARDNDLGGFNVVDAATGAVKKRFDLGRGAGSYGVAVAADESVYVATNSLGKLFRWQPGADTIEDLGRLAASESHLYKLAFDPDGRVYTGTYPGGRVLRYDPATKQVHDYGQASAGQTYVRSIGYHNGTVYAGTQPHAHLVAIDAAGGAKREIALPDGTDLDQVFYDITIVGDLLFGRVSKTGVIGTLLVYDLTAGTWRAQIPEVSGLDVSQRSESGLVYFSKDMELTAYDPDTEELTPTGLKMPETAQLRGIGFGRLPDADFPGQSVIGGLWTGEMLWHNPQSGAHRLTQTRIEPNPVRMRSLGIAPDGRVVTGGTGTGAVGFVDPATGDATAYRTSEQMGIGAIAGRIYLGSYPRARLYEYLPGQPWNYNGLDPAKPANPREVYNGDAVKGDRPFAMLPVRGRLAVGTVNKSGYLGGQLLFHDPRTGDTEVHDALVEDQSMMSLARIGGILYIGTSVYGGYGADETQTDAELVAWDLDKGEKLWGRVPVPGERTISSLTVDHAGMLWGVTATVIFRYDPRTQEVTARRYRDYQWPVDGGYALADLRVHPRDRQLYGSMPGIGLYRLDPRTWKMTVLTDRPVYRMTLHPNGDVFANDGPELLRWRP